MITASPGLALFPEGTQPPYDGFDLGTLEGSRQHGPLFRGDSIRRHVQRAVDREKDERRSRLGGGRMGSPVLLEALVEEERPCVL